MMSDECRTKTKARTSRTGARALASLALFASFAVPLCSAPRAPRPAPRACGFARPTRCPRTRSRLGDALAHRVLGQLRHAVQVQLLHEIPAVGLDGFNADVELA